MRIARPTASAADALGGTDYRPARRRNRAPPRRRRTSACLGPSGLDGGKRWL